MEHGATSGERISEEEEHAVKQMNADQSEGTKEIPVLFEEMDGVWPPYAGQKPQKDEKAGNEGIHHVRGWDEEKEKQNRSTLAGKRIAGRDGKKRRVHEKREACIRKEYNADGIRQRILNGTRGMDQKAI